MFIKPGEFALATTSSLLTVLIVGGGSDEPCGPLALSEHTQAESTWQELRRRQTSPPLPPKQDTTLLCKSWF